MLKKAIDVKITKRSCVKIAKQLEATKPILADTWRKDILLPIF
jgi:hypothetical protein